MSKNPNSAFKEFNSAMVVHENPHSGASGLPEKEKKKNILISTNTGRSNTFVYHDKPKKRVKTIYRLLKTILDERYDAAIKICPNFYLVSIGVSRQSCG